MHAIPDTPELRKARGAFFTPPEVTRYICDWAIRSPDDQVYEPSCGEADFLMAAGQRLRALGARKVDETLLRGAELHEDSARGALRELDAHGMSAGIDVADFFDVDLAPHQFDVIAGNPPYVRYQAFQGAARLKAQKAALAAGVKLSGLSSSWAAFTIACGELVKPDGRLGFVLPAELLSTNYGGPVRSYLTRRFRSVKLIMFDERVFPGVLAEVVLLLAEGRGPAKHVEVSRARNLALLGDPPITYWRPSDPEGKWTPGLLPTDAAEAYAGLLKTAAFTELDGWGKASLGMVTGNNRYFCLTADEARILGLTENELVRISPPGSRHLRGLAFGERAWEDLAEDGRRVFLFRPKHDLEHEMSESAAAYIEAGRMRGVQKAYKCRVRTPWWEVPGIRRPDLFLTYMNHDTPRLVTNAANVAYLNSVHGITLKAAHRALGRDVLPVAALNSVTLLGAELVGRSYGGGILKVEPKEAELLPLPSVAVVSEAREKLWALGPHLAQLLRKGDLQSAVQEVDRVLLVEHLGLKRALVRQLREAREAMFQRRVSRASKPA